MTSIIIKYCQDNLSFFLTRFSFPVHIICGVTLDHSSLQYFPQENTSLYSPVQQMLWQSCLRIISEVVITHKVHMACLINNGFYIWKMKSSQNTGLV